MAKRFGCLAYSKIMVPNGPLANKAEKCIFLGMAPESSAWLLGTFRKDTRTKGGLRFIVIESKSARFAPSVLVDSLDRLRPDNKGYYLPMNEIEKYLGDLERPSSPMVPPVPPPESRPTEGPVNGDLGIDTGALDTDDPPPRISDDEFREILDGYRTSDDESEEPPPKKQKADLVDPAPAPEPKKRGRPKKIGPSSTSNSSSDKGGAKIVASPCTSPKS